MCSPQAAACFKEQEVDIQYSSHRDLEGVVGNVQLADQMVRLEPETSLDGRGARVGRGRQRAAACRLLLLGRSSRFR